MSSELDPRRLLDGGLVDGMAPSPEMLELLGALRSATPEAVHLRHLHAGALHRGSWGRWLVVVALTLGVATTATSPSIATSADDARGTATAARVDATATAPGSATATAGAISASRPPLGDADATIDDALERTEPSARATPEAGSAPREERATRSRTRRAPPRAARAAREHASRAPATLTLEETTVIDDDDTSVAPAAGAVAAAARVEPGLAALAGEDIPPSEVYAAALAEYARGCCDCAVTPLQRVIEGSTGDAPAAVRRSELLLGVCLARLGWTQSAVAVLDGIVQVGAEHPYFSEALTELARLAPSLPDPSVLVSSFRHDDEARLAGEDEPLAAAAAAYLQGRARYEERDLSAAARLWQRVPSASPFYRAARFYEGLAEVRLRHAGRAEVAFRAVLDASPEGDPHHDLSTLALARLYYAAASGGHDEASAAEDERASALLGAALEAWARVPLTSEHFLDAFFEESWALYLVGEEERALGHVFGLLSPFFEGTEHPEAWVVRGTIHFEHCLYDEADADVREFHARYDAVLEGLDALTGMSDDEAIALRSSEGGSLAGPTRSLVLSSIRDRDSERRLEHLRAVEAELERLGSASFANGTLGIRLEQELGVSVALGRTRLADGIRERLESAREALRDRMNEIDRIALETTTARRDVLTGASVLSEESSREREVIADMGYEVWPFDGEYWADEVTSYREVIRDRCGR